MHDLRLLRFAAGLGLASLYLNLVDPVVILVGKRIVLRLLSPRSCLLRNLVQGRLGIVQVIIVARQGQIRLALLQVLSLLRASLFDRVDMFEGQLRYVR